MYKYDLLSYKYYLKIDGEFFERNLVLNAK